MLHLQAPVLVVGTRIDEVPLPEIDQAALRRDFKQIQGFFGVSSKTLEGIEQLKQSLMIAAMRQEYMGAAIPEKWLVLENALLLRKQKNSKVGYMKWNDFEDLCKDCAFSSAQHMESAACFLHDIGSIIHYSDREAVISGLDQMVVTDKQWLANVMKCIISAQASKKFVNQGMITDSDLKQAWNVFPADIHEQLLELLLKVDLAFQIPNQSGEERKIMVPCLLSEIAPPQEEIDAFLQATASESPIYVQVFALAFSPYGFFNLLQVRLREYEAGISVKHDQPQANVPALWRYGLALRTVTPHGSATSAVLIFDPRRNEVQCRLSGKSLDNMRAIVTEAIHTIMTEKYSVDYDIFIPCHVCLASGEEPHMFSLSKTVQRARDKNQIFLQCQTAFHMIPVTSFLRVFKPSHIISDLQIQSMLEGIALDRALVASKVYISCTAGDRDRRDFKAGSSLKALLQENCIESWLPSFASEEDQQRNLLALTSSDIVICLISEEYWSDENSSTMKEAQIFCKTSPKPVVPVVISDPAPSHPMAWSKSLLGLLLAGKLYVDIRSQAEYEDNKNHLLMRVQQLLQAQGLRSQKGRRFDFMVSYAWANSSMAAAAGQVAHGAANTNTFSDPRWLHRRLTEKMYYYKGWLDIEQLPLAGGLFEGIRSGLNSSKCVLICMSDAYARSANCLMECKFSIKTLRKPVILVLVGEEESASTVWKSTEAGMLTQEYWDAHCHGQEKIGVRCVDLRAVKDEKDFETRFQRLVQLLVSRSCAFPVNLLTRLALNPHQSS